MDFLKKLADDDNERKEQEHKPASHAPPPAHHSEEHKGGMFNLDKIKDALGGESTKAAPPPPAEHHDEGMLGMLKGALGGEKEHKTPPPPAPKPKEHGLIDSFTSKLGGQHEPERPAVHEDQGILGKLSGVVGGHHEEKKPKQEEGLMGKLNSALGGGAKGEEKEDALDKAIDYVQEHVLKAGDQRNESAIEQAKDEHISDAIRRQFKGMTGHDVPVKDKE